MARFVLIVTILIGLGAAFLGWKTKEQAEAVQADLLKKNKELVATKAKLKQTEETLKQTQETLAQTEEKLKQTETELTNTKGELANTKTELASVKSELEEKNAKIAKIQADLDKLVALGIDATKIEELGQKMKDLAESNKRLETELAEAKQVAAGLNTKVEGLNTEVTTKQRTIDEYKTGFVKNGLTGRVLAFNPGWNFVVLSLGDKAGMKVGAQLVITRGGAMIGKAKVTSVEPGQSIADVLPGTIARGESVQPGDTVVYEGKR